MRQTKSLIAQDVDGAIASLRAARETETKVIISEAGIVRENLGETLRLATEVIARDEPVIQAHSAQVRELTRDKEDPWSSPVDGRGHVQYKHLDDALKAFHIRANRVLPYLRAVPAEVERIAGLPEVARVRPIAELQ